MNIQFNIIAHGLEKAAKLEKFLKENSIAFEAGIAKGVCENRKKRATVGKAEVMAVIDTAQRHHSWTQEQIGKATNVSHSTVGRILQGTHALQRTGEAPKPIAQQRPIREVK